MSELVYVTFCGHGVADKHLITGELQWCPGGTEQVLDDDKVLHEVIDWMGMVVRHVKVADVKAVLDQEE